MNWITQPEERLENLPKFQKFEDDKHYDCYWGQGMPWARMKRWFESQEGVHVDSAFHKFVNLKWLLAEYRTKEEFRRHVETHTFWQDGKICYYTDYCSTVNGKTYRVVENDRTKTIYVHPDTRIICVHRPATPKNHKSLWQIERDARLRILGDYHQLYKHNGIWYEIKAEVVKLWNIPPHIHLKCLESSRNFKPYLKKGRWVGYPQKAKHDILLEEESNYQWRDERHPIKITMKRQLNSKELKQLGLTNDRR